MGIQNGSKVCLHYVLKVNGMTVSSTVGNDPIVYTHGEGQMLQGLEEQITGMDKGDRKSFDLPPEKGFGKRDPKTLQKISRSKFKEASKIEKGSMVQFTVNGQPMEATVVDVNEDCVTIDMGHPLAGETLHFDVEILGVE